MFLPGESQQPTPTSIIDFEAEENTIPSKNTASESRNNEDILQESDMTPLATDGSTTSEEDTAATGSGGGGWFGGMGTDFRNIAISLKEGVPSTFGAIGDIASFVQRSALSVAAEIAQLERDSDDEGGDLEHSLRLPWEISTTGIKSTAASEDNGGSDDDDDDDDDDYQDDEELKAQILALSVSHDTFLKPFKSKGSDCSAREERNFVVLDEPRIRLIRQLLEIDEQLAATHAHLSGRSDVKESVFWTNYFFNCEKVRREHSEYLNSLSPVSVLSNTNNNSDDDTNEDRNNNTIAIGEETVSHTSQNSLVPAEDDSSDISLGIDDDDGDSGSGSGAIDDDSSYIQVMNNNSKGIASSPCSLKSVEDLILVTKHAQGENE